MKQIRNGQPMTIFGDGKQTRAFSYISDVAPIIARSVERKKCYNQVFNVGADHAYSVLELAREVAQCMDVKPDARHLEARNEVVNAYSAHEKARKFFGDLIGDVSLHDGLARMSDWAKTAKLRKTKSFKGIEVVKNLPPSWAAMMKK
jgi:UDP-glucose 4-epimerase